MQIFLISRTLTGKRKDRSLRRLSSCRARPRTPRDLWCWRDKPSGTSRRVVSPIIEISRHPPWIIVSEIDLPQSATTSTLPQMTHTHLKIKSYGWNTMTNKPVQIRSRPVVSRKKTPVKNNELENVSHVGRGRKGGSRDHFLIHSGIAAMMNYAIFVKQNAAKRQTNWMDFSESKWC